MIDKEIRKIGTNRDKMETLIKHNMSVQHHKKCLLEKKTTFSSNIKQSTVFFFKW